MTPVAKSDSKNIFSWSNGIFLIFCCIVTYIVFKNVTELKTINMLFKQIDGWWIALAVIAQAVTYFCVAAIYYLLINKFKGGHKVHFQDLFQLSIVTVFINQIVPSGGIGGNGFLFNEVTKRGVSQKKAFFTIVMECLSLYVSLAALLIVLPVFYIANHGALPPWFLITIIFGMLLYGFLAAFMTILSVKETLQRVIKKLSRVRFLKRYVENITFSPQGTFSDHHTEGPWGIFLKYKKGMLLCILCQFGVFFADALTLFALLRGLHVGTSFLIISFGLLLTFVAAAIPISPGSLLLYEGAMTFFYTSMGMPFQTALVVTLLYRVLSFWAPIVMGLFLYKHVQKDEK